MDSEKKEKERKHQQMIEDIRKRKNEYKEESKGLPPVVERVGLNPF